MRNPKTSAPIFGLPSAALLRKITVIVLLICATQIASFFMSDFVAEREERNDQMTAEFKKTWGSDQVLQTPVLVIPYQMEDGASRMLAMIGAETVNVSAQVVPQQRQRGIFSANVYESNVGISGAFRIPDEAKLQQIIPARAKHVLWEESYIALNTADIANFKADGGLFVGDKELPWQSCSEWIYKVSGCRDHLTVIANLGALAAAGPTDIPFKLALALHGTDSLKLQYWAKSMSATIGSPWPNPSFIGDRLPQSDTVTQQGFEAKWMESELAMPDRWKTVGVNFLDATPTYRMIHRTSKYALLFIILSFVTYFMFELLSGVRIHAVQYGLLACSLSLFSLLLLSIGEFLGFGLGYCVSAGLVLLQSSIYTASVARQPKQAGIFALMLASLFGFLYVLLSLESYSLLVGSLGLFGVLSVLMALTQKIDWSAAAAEEPSKA